MNQSSIAQESASKTLDFGTHPYDTDARQGVYCGLTWTRPDWDTLEIPAYLIETPKTTKCTRNGQDLRDRGYNDIIVFHDKDQGGTRPMSGNTLITKKQGTLVLVPISYSYGLSRQLKSNNPQFSRIGVNVETCGPGYMHHRLLIDAIKNGYWRREKHNVDTERQGLLEAWVEAVSEWDRQHPNGKSDTYYTSAAVNWLVTQMTPTARERIKRATQPADHDLSENARGEVHAAGYQTPPTTIYSFDANDFVGDQLSSVAIEVNADQMQMHATIRYNNRLMNVKCDEKGISLETAIEIPQSIVEELKGKPLPQMIDAPWAQDSKIRSILQKNDKITVRASSEGQPLVIADQDDANDEEARAQRLSFEIEEKTKRYGHRKIDATMMPFLKTLSDEDLITFIDEVMKPRMKDQTSMPLAGWGWPGWSVVNFGEYVVLKLTGPDVSIAELLKQRFDKESIP